jgi:hypothetical protein
VGPSSQWQCRLAPCPDWLPWAAMSERVGRVESHPDWPFSTGRVRKRRRAADTASPRLTCAVPTVPPPVPKADHVTVRAPCPCRVRHRRCPAASAVAKSSTVSGAPSAPPLAAFSLWTVEPSFLSPLHPDVGPPPAAGALTSSENVAADPVFPPSLRQETPVSYRLHPHARWVASPPWVLERLRLLHLHHGSATAGRAATRARRGHPPWATCAMHTGRAGAVDVGHALLCNWVERGFGPVAVELVFYFSNIFKSLQI